MKCLYVFGSVLTEGFGKNSDIDLLVDFLDIPTEDYADNYFDFKFSLQEVLKRPIDLLENQAITNPYLKASLNQQRRLLYAE